MNKHWYSYSGYGDPTLAKNYTKSFGIPACVGGSYICAIYVHYNGLIPRSPLSANIQTYIANGLAQQVPQPQFPFGNKLFVYMKFTN